MRIVVIGATGTIGRAVCRALEPRHDVITVGNKSGDVQVDLANSESIRTLYRAIGSVDAVVSTAGRAVFGDLAKLTDEDFAFSLSHKLMGQVNLVRIGASLLSDRGSFTLTSGVLSQEPMKGSAAISLVNGGLDGFVRAAALELPRGLRINVVSPTWVTETLKARGMDLAGGMPADEVALAYVESVEGTKTGQVLNTRMFRR
ncbi:MAG: short chain dehydrogenase [Nitrospiraceae bacterium]